MTYFDSAKAPRRDNIPASLAPLPEQPAWAQVIELVLDSWVQFMVRVLASRQHRSSPSPEHSLDYDFTQNSQLTTKSFRQEASGSNS